MNISANRPRTSVSAISSERPDEAILLFLFEAYVGTDKFSFQVLTLETFRV